MSERSRNYVRLRAFDFDQQSLVRVMDQVGLVHRVRVRVENESCAGMAQRFIDSEVVLRGDWSAYWFPANGEEYVVFGFSDVVDAVACRLTT